MDRMERIREGVRAALVAAFDFHWGALARAFGYSSVLDLGPFYFKLRVDALFSYSQALNRADFEAERQTSPNFEPPTSNAIPELQINRKLRVDALKAAPRL